MCAHKEKLPTVDELARKHGEFIPAKPGCKWLQDRYSARHAAASTRHGWGAHRYHAQEPMRVSSEDYLAALAAVGPETGPRFKVHPGALSQHCQANDEAKLAALCEHRSACNHDPKANPCELVEHCTAAPVVKGD